MPQVLALLDDLFFQAKMLETAKHVGVDLRACATPDALLGEVAKEAPKLVVVDLNARNNPLAAIERMQATARNVPIVAFVSHVQADLAARASAAGCSVVMPRSQFTRELATILERAKSESP